MKKLLIWIIALFLVLPFSLAVTEDRIIAWWTLDTDGTDATGNGFTLTESTITHVPMKINDGAITEGSSGSNLETSVSLFGNGNVSISGWINHSNPLVVSDAWFAQGETSSSVVFGMRQNSDTNLQAFVGGDAGFYLNVNVVIGAGTSPIDHYVMIFDDTEPRLTVCVNGIVNATDNTPTGNLNIPITTFKMGAEPTGANPGAIGIDEMGIWNRTLNLGNTTVGQNCGGEVADLFNNGAGITFTDFAVTDTQPPVFNQSSINNSNPRINEVVALSQVVSDETALNQVRLFHNQTGTFVNQTPQTISGTSFNATFNLTITLSRANVIGFGWHVSDTAGNVNISDITTFEVANTPPEQATILFPTANLITNLQPLDINVTFPSDADGDVITINYYINITLNQSSTTNTTLNASDNLYVLNVELNDGFASSTNATVTFEIDTTFPVITITNPVNGTTFSADIAVDISCVDLHPFILNYTLFNASSQAERSIQENVSVGNTLTIIDTIPIENLTDGTFTLNISCSDTHTTKAIEDYFPFKDLGNLKLFYTIKEDLVGIKLKSSTATLDDFGTFRDTDRYIFWFDFTEPETSTVYEYVFKIDNKEKLTYLPDSEFKGHFVTKNNWIDFEFDGNEGAIYAIKETQDNKYEVNIKTTKTFLNFKSIGGLNVATSQVIITLDTTVPAVPEVEELPFASPAQIVGMLVLLLIILQFAIGGKLMFRRTK